MAFRPDDPFQLSGGIGLGHLQGVTPGMRPQVSDLASALSHQPGDDDEGGSLAPLAAPLAPAMLYGIGAKNADLDKLTKAKLLHHDGASEDEIRRLTGWEIDPRDGKWKFERSDKDMRILTPPQEIAPGEQGNMPEFKPLRERVHHPELFENYPELGDIDSALLKSPGIDPYFAELAKITGIQASSPPPTGSYGEDPATGKAQLQIEATNPEDFREIILHEMQHPIQNKEGWGQGGNPADPTYEPMAEEIWNEHRNKLKEMMTELDDMAKELYGDTGGVTGMSNLSTEQRGEVMDRWANDNPKRATEMRERMAMVSEPERIKFDVYHRQHGEVGARTTMKRGHMTQEEMIETPRSQTQDVPWHRQIVRTKPGGPFLKSQPKNIGQFLKRIITRGR